MASLNLRNRRYFLSTLVATGAATFFYPFSRVRPLNVGVFVPSSFPLIGSFFNQFLGELSKEIQAPVKIKFLHEINLHRLVSKGELDFAITSSCRALDNGISSIFNSVPFGLPPQAHKKWMNREGAHLKEQYYKQQGFNLSVLSFANIGTQNGGWLKRPINSTQDLSNLVARVSGPTARLLRSYGAKVQDFDHRVSSSKTLSQYDYFEWGGDYLDQNFGLHHAFPYKLIEPWQNPNISFELIANSRIWKNWDAERRQRVQILTAAAGNKLTHLWENQDRKVKLSSKPTHLPDPVLHSLRERSIQLLLEQAHSPLEKMIIFSHFSFQT